MSKTDTEVVIGGKVFTLSGAESEEYLQKVAAYLNNKMQEFDHVEDYRRFSPDMRAVLLQLNIADDYFKTKGLSDSLERDIEDKDRDAYERKQELISLRMEVEKLQKEIERLRGNRHNGR